MSQNVQPVEEKTLSAEDKAKALTSEVLNSLGITQDMAQKAAAIGIPVDKLALTLGVILENQKQLNDAVIKLSDGIKPAVELSTKIKELEAARAASGGQTTPQLLGGAAPGFLGLLQQYAPLLQTFGLGGSTANPMQDFFVNLGQKVLVDSISLQNVLNRNAMRKMSGGILAEYEKEQRDTMDTLTGKKKIEPAMAIAST